jgi:Tol biopolymer transport system component
MAISSSRLRLAATCALVVAVAASFSLQPVLAQSGSDSWEVADSLIVDTDGFAPVLSPDGRWVAGLKELETRQLCVWKVSSGEERCNDESERVADVSIAWSPDSRQVAFSQNGHELDSDVFVLDVASNSLTNLTEDDVDDLKAATTAGRFVIYDQWPAWSADGSELVFLRILNPRDEQGQRQLSVSRVIMETGQVVRGQDLVTDEPLAFVAETVGMITPLLWLADGTVVFSIRGGRDIAGVYSAGVDGGPPVLIDSSPSIPAAKAPVLTGATADGSRLTMYWLWEEIAIDDEFYSFGWLDMGTGEITPIVLDVPRSHVIAAPPRLSADGTTIVYGVTRDEATHQDSTIMIQDLEGGDPVEIVDGVDLQLWESVGGIEWTAANQLVVPLSDGGFEIVTLEQS